MNDDAVDNKAEQATDATKHSVAPGGSKNSTSGAAASQSEMLSEIKSEPVWSSYLDPEDETTVLFYNRVTKESQKTKPADYDGHYVIGEGAAKKEDSVAAKIYNRTFGDMTKMFFTPLEDPNANQTQIVIEDQPGPALGLGQWEEVKEEEQFEVVNRVREDLVQRD